MTKTQAALLLAVGAAVGVGGKQAIEALTPGTVEAAPLLPFTHAVDLRRDYSARDAGTLHVTVYATQPSVDGGTKDVGQAKSCKPTEETTKKLIEEMNALAKECVW